MRARLTPPTAPLPGDLAILPVSALTGIRGARPGLARRDHAVGSIDVRPDDHDCDLDSPTIEIDSLMDLVRETIAPQAWDDTALMGAIRDHLIVTADPQILQQVRARLTALERQTMATVEVEYRNPVATVTMPGLAGISHAVRFGRTWTSIHELQGEVAKHASILVPLVEDTFSGIEFSLRANVIEQQPCARLNWFSRRAEVGSPGHTAPAVHSAVREHVGRLPAEGLLPGDGPFGAERWRLHQN